ncbi:MAG TPA: choice-of-anchor tandem repeat GloVer-containing protein [Candidatus Sulfotelmatobacter sp.]
MKTVSARSLCMFAIFFAGISVFLVSPSQAQSFSVIRSFADNDGTGPLAGLAMDAKENLYGTASSGGVYGDGVVFKASRNGAEMVLHSFGHGDDGSTPESSVIFDATGNLYGTTFVGGAFSSGTVFKISAKGTEAVLYSFGGVADGANPIAGLAMDKAGNLYGTTSAGGTFNAGTVFKVSPTGKHTVIYNFGQGVDDGSTPVAGITLDSEGNLYGTTSVGGVAGYGTVFELKPSASAWKETILHQFELQNDGGTPYAGLIFDQSGNLYGAATQGGDGSGGGGTVFELTPSGGRWSFKVLYGLAGWNISGTFRDLLLDSTTGIIYATTHCDGLDDAGTVYALTPSSGSWIYNQLYTFTGGADGLYSFSNLVIDKSGYLYGTTFQGGANGFGVIFRIKP